MEAKLLRAAVAVLALAFVFCSAAWAEFVDVPVEIQERADRYIAGKVGKEYFEENYRFRILDSYGSPHDGGVEYFLYYDYLPLKRLVNDLALDRYTRVFVRMFERPDYHPSEWVADVRNGKIREPIVPRAEAIRAVEEHMGVPLDAATVKAIPIKPSFVEHALSWTWNVIVPVKKTASCETDHYFQVEMIEGKVIDKGVRRWCM